MRTAVANYASYRQGEHGWALGSFVVPASRLREFDGALRELQATDGFDSTTAGSSAPTSPWNLSVLVGEDYERDHADIRDFQSARGSRANISAIEAKLSDVRLLHPIEKLFRSTIQHRFYEVPLTSGKETLSMIRDYRACAKIRTGGVVSTAFPEPVQIADFLIRCATVNVGFKATAGLHHPVRCVKPLTYADDAPTGVMHGFMNVFLAAALACQEVKIDNLCAADAKRMAVSAVLSQSEAENLMFNDSGVRLKVSLDHDGDMRTHEFNISTEQIKVARERFALSFGSCSFVEPISDLEALKLL